MVVSTTVWKKAEKKDGKIANGEQENQDEKIIIDIVLVRVTKDVNKPLNSTAMAKPCSDCLDFLKSTPGIRYVYYTNEKGDLVGELVKNMTTTHICRSKRKAMALY